MPNIGQIYPVGNGGFTLPTDVRTVANADDRFIGIDATTGLLYTITKSDLLAGLSGGGSVTPPSTSYPTGMALLLDGGSLLDKSGNARNAFSVGGTLPSIATGIDNQQVLRWNGSGTQELQVTSFLDSTVGATLYCVFTVASTGNYNLVRTANIDDYWRFVNGNGYFGTFQNARNEGYPINMPSSGNHLISIHANSNSYEVVLDTVSKGILNTSYMFGDRFRIATNDKAFSGDIATLLVYPQYSQPNSTSDLGVRNKIKATYPSLPF